MDLDFLVHFRDSERMLFYGLLCNLEFSKLEMPVGKNRMEKLRSFHVTFNCTAFCISNIFIFWLLIALLFYMILVLSFLYILVMVLSGGLIVISKA